MTGPQGAGKMEVSQRQKRNKRPRGRDLPEEEPCKGKMAWTEQVGTESGFAPGSPVCLSQAGVTWKAPQWWGAGACWASLGERRQPQELLRPKGSR